MKTLMAGEVNEETNKVLQKITSKMNLLKVKQEKKK